MLTRMPARMLDSAPLHSITRSKPLMPSERRARSATCSACSALPISTLVLAPSSSASFRRCSLMSAAAQTVVGQPSANAFRARRPEDAAEQVVRVLEAVEVAPRREVRGKRGRARRSYQHH